MEVAILTKKIMKKNNVFAAIMACLLAFWVTAIASWFVWFWDITPNDPGYNATMKYYQKWAYEWIDWEAKLDDVIWKTDAALFLAKVLWATDPTPEDVAKLWILSAAPDTNDPINHATWIKMLSNAFKVPLWNTTENQPWFIAPYVVAQSITAINDEKPFDLASRRFVLTSTELYENIFATKTAVELMSQQEARLMQIRDMLLDPNADSDLIDDLLWTNIVEAEQVPPNKRINAIKNLNMALFALFDLKLHANSPKKIRIQNRVKFFVGNAVAYLPDVEPFSEDLIKISQR